jgi:hypothetical protein
VVYNAGSCTPPLWCSHRTPSWIRHIVRACGLLIVGAGHAILVLVLVAVLLLGLELLDALVEVPLE